MDTHYVYKITDTKTNQYYFGSRTCKCNPEDDGYMGSMLTWDISEADLEKEILKSGFETREEAIKFEAIMISMNIDDDLNENYHIPPDKFHTYGLPVVKDREGNVFRVKRNDPRIKEGELEMFWSGRTHSEESKRKMSESAKNRDINPKREKLRRNKISETLKGYKRSEKNIENIRKAKMGENNPMYGRCGKDHPNSKKCFQYSKGGKFMREWVSATVAADELGLKYNPINACLNNKQKSSQGFIWSYEKINDN